MWCGDVNYNEVTLLYSDDDVQDGLNYPALQRLTAGNAASITKVLCKFWFDRWRRRTPPEHAAGISDEVG